MIKDYIVIITWFDYSLVNIKVYLLGCYLTPFVFCHGNNPDIEWVIN